jgi:ribosomal protein L18E
MVDCTEVVGILTDEDEVEDLILVVAVVIGVASPVRVVAIAAFRFTTIDIK